MRGTILKLLTHYVNTFLNNLPAFIARAYQAIDLDRFKLFQLLIKIPDYLTTPQVSPKIGAAPLGGQDSGVKVNIVNSALCT